MLKRIAAACTLLFVSGCGADPDRSAENAVRACEARLKSSLTSPASYRRLWSNVSPAAPMTRAELIEANEANRVRADRQGNDAAAIASAMIEKCLREPNGPNCGGLRYEDVPHLPTAFVLVQYEAVNSFNVKLPGYFMCRTTQTQSGDYSEDQLLTGTELPRAMGDQLKSQADLARR